MQAPAPAPPVMGVWGAMAILCHSSLVLDDEFSPDICAWLALGPITVMDTTSLDNRHLTDTTFPYIFFSVLLDLPLLLISLFLFLLLFFHLKVIILSLESVQLISYGFFQQIFMYWTPSCATIWCTTDLAVWLLLQACTTHTQRKACISCRYHSLGWEELSKKSKQQKIHRNQSLDSQHDGALSADWGHITKVSPRVAIHSLLCQGNLRQCMHRINPISVHSIPTENSALCGLMGQREKENIIHLLVWYGIYAECYL